MSLPYAIGSCPFNLPMAVTAGVAFALTILFAELIIAIIKRLYRRGRRG